MTESELNLTNVAKTFIILFTFGFAVFNLASSSKSNLVSAKDKSVSVDEFATMNQTSGVAIYKSSCIRCHGGDGKSNTARGKRKGATDLTKSRISFSKGIRIITNGRSRMPSFKEDLSKKQIQNVNSYIRKFRK